MFTKPYKKIKRDFVFPDMLQIVNAYLKEI